MLDTFLATLQPMLTLFTFIALGFLLFKIKIVPEDGSKVLAKILTFAVCPALSFTSMAKYFTIDNLLEHFVNLILGSFAVGVAFIITLCLIGLFVKDKQAYERGIYKYALTFGNMGYVGDPIVIALFGLEGLAFYKIATLPFLILIYTWGIAILVPNGGKKQSFVKSILNVPTIGLFVGMFAGIIGLGNVIFNTQGLKFLADGLTGLGNCMGPLAMLLAGVTVARFDIKTMLTNKKVYLASLFRLIIIPTFVIGCMFGIMSLANLVFNASINNSFLFLVFFAVATPLGMNTIVFPEAYGGDPSTGAGMTMISHTLCVITIPLTFALLTYLFGPMPIF